MSERSTGSSRADHCSQKTHDNKDMLARNRLSNVSFFVCSAGELVVLAILAGILVAIVDPNDPDSNTRALSIVCAYSAGVWSERLGLTTKRSWLKRAVLCAIPWLFFEQYRPGNQLPPNTNYFNAG